MRPGYDSFCIYFDTALPQIKIVKVAVTCNANEPVYAINCRSMGIRCMALGAIQCLVSFWQQEPGGTVLHPTQASRPEIRNGVTIITVLFCVGPLPGMSGRRSESNRSTSLCCHPVKYARVF